MQPEVRTEVLNRLKNVRGHIAGIERMIEEGQQCSSLLIQVAAVRSAVEKVGFFLLETNAVDCLCDEMSADSPDRDKVEQIIKQLLSFVK
jgi:DNA-binding FrmR family transcriptional regulator